MYLYFILSLLQNTLHCKAVPEFVIYSLIDEHLCSFYFGAIMNNSAMTNHVQGSSDICFHLSWVYTQE